MMLGLCAKAEQKYFYFAAENLFHALRKKRKE